MDAGIRATVAFDSATVCPLAARAAEAGATVIAAHTSVGTPAGERSHTDVATSAELGEAPDLTPLFSGAGTFWYRYEHGEVACPCAALGRFGIPVVRYSVSADALTIVFHASDYDQLQATVDELRERFPGVDIRRLIRSPDEGEASDSVYVDRARLTERQLEVLGTALGMGYFERPRVANATEVAAELDIDPSTFSEHLAAAQRKLLEDVLERGR